MSAKRKLISFEKIESENSERETDAGLTEVGGDDGILGGSEIFKM